MFSKSGGETTRVPYDAEIFPPGFVQTAWQRALRLPYKAPLLGCLGVAGWLEALGAEAQYPNPAPAHARFADQSGAEFKRSSSCSRVRRSPCARTCHGCVGTCIEMSCTIVFPAAVRAHTGQAGSLCARRCGRAAPCKASSKGTRSILEQLACVLVHDADATGTVEHNMSHVCRRSMHRIRVQLACQVGH